MSSLLEEEKTDDAYLKNKSDLEFDALMQELGVDEEVKAESVPVPDDLVPPFDPAGLNIQGPIEKNPAYAKKPIDGYASQALIGGPVAAINSALRGVEDFVVGMEEKGFPNAYLQILNEKGEFSPDLLNKEEAQALREAQGGSTFQVPNIQPSTSAGKQAVREISQWLTGFTLTKGKLGKGKTVAQEIGKDVTASVTAGAVFMDEQRDRLFDLFERIPGLDDITPDFLLNDEDDSNLEGRLKNGLEEIGAGVLLEPLTQGIRLLRKGKPIEEDALVNELTDEEFFSLGDLAEDAPAIGAAKDFVKPVGGKKLKQADIKPDELLEKGLVEVGKKGGKPVYINFARIDTPDDVKSVIDTMAQTFAKDIDKAGRGKITQAETKELAEELGMSVDDLLKRRSGQAFNAEQAIASRKILATSADKLMQLAEKASGPTATPKDVFLFRKMAALHRGIQAEVIGARKEVARALASYRIPVGAAERNKAIETLLGAEGGDKVGVELAKRMMKLTKLGTDPAGVNAAIRHGALATTLDAVKESYILGLLWTPSTHVVNTIGNTIAMTDSIVNTAVASRINKAVGKNAIEEGGVVAGEAKAKIFAIKSSWRDALRHAYKSARGQESTVGGINRVEIESRDIKQAISAEAFGISNTTLGTAVDYIGAGVRAPGVALTFNDELFKTFGYRMEVHAQAWRMASQEGLEEGSQEFSERVATIISSPPENIRIDAVDAALYNTFQNEVGPIGEGLLKLRSGAGVVGYAFMPFGKTPINLFTYSAERTPLAFTVKKWRDDIAAGGARKDLAIAKMTTGTLTAGMFYDFAKAGYITGGGPNESRGLIRRIREQDIISYAVVFSNGLQVDLSRLDPLIAMTASVMADIVDLTERFDFDESDEAFELIKGSGLAIGRAMNNKSYLRVIGEVTDAISGGPGAGDRIAGTLLSAAVPMSTLWASVERIQDPELREAMGVLQYVQSRLPVISKNLIPKRNMYGQKIKPGAGPYDVITPLKIKTAKDVPLSREMLRLKVSAEPIPYKNVLWDGVSIESFKKFPKVLDEYRKLAGNELKHPLYGKGFLDAGNDIVQGKGPFGEIYKNYLSDDPGGGKAQKLSSLWSEYKKMARDEIINGRKYRDDPEFKKFRLFIKELEKNKPRKMDIR